MSKYTISIMKLIDNGFDFQLDEYPIFDEAYRSTLNQAILDYYYMYEIGFDSPNMFRHYLKTTLSMVMPKYNAMFKAQTEILENPLGNVNLTETKNRTTETTGESQGTSVNEGKTLFQDTPMGKLKNTSIDNQEWATNLTQDKNSASNTNNTSTNGVDNYIKTIIGNNGNKYNVEVYAKLKNTFVSINMEIINELSDLFMGVL